MNTGTFLLDLSSTPGSSTVLGTKNRERYGLDKQGFFTRLVIHLGNKTVKGQAPQEQAGSTTGC